VHNIPVNKNIWETIYDHALKALADIAAKVHMKLMLEPLSKICLMPVNVYVICAEHYLITVVLLYTKVQIFLEDKWKPHVSNMDGGTH
jgi:hypothetical protein